MIWMIISLTLALALGLSVAGLVLGYRQGLWNNVIRYFLVGLLGTVISATMMVLIIIAIWPPFDMVSLLLPAGFILLLAGGLYFVRATVTEENEQLPLFKSNENIC